MAIRIRLAVAAAVVALVLVAAARAGMLFLRTGQPGPRTVAGSTRAGDEWLTSVSFADANRGSVTVLRHPQQIGGPHDSYLTQDGGRTWLPGDLVTYLADSMAIRRGASGTFLSSDRGRTWGPLTVPEPAAGESAPTFLDREHGWWAVGVSGPDPGQARLWRTEDGGRTWRRAEAAGIPAGLTPLGLVWLDSLHALLSMTGMAGPSLLLTEDGGRTWRPTLAPAYPLHGDRPYALFAWSHGSRLLVYLAAFTPSPVNALADGPDDVDGYVFASDDGGRSWGPPAAGPNVRSSAIEAPVVDAGGRLLVLAGARLWVSADDGATWTARTMHIPAGWTADELGAASDGTLFATAISASSQRDDGLIRSTDGGATWKQVPLP